VRALHGDSDESETSWAVKQGRDIFIWRLKRSRAITKVASNWGEQRRVEKREGARQPEQFASVTIARGVRVFKLIGRGVSQNEKWGVSTGSCGGQRVWCFMVGGGKTLRGHLKNTIFSSPKKSIMQTMRKDKEGEAHLIQRNKTQLGSAGPGRHSLRYAKGKEKNRLYSETGEEKHGNNRIRVSTRHNLAQLKAIYKKNGVLK